jgi:hypothetical protein
MVSDIDKKAAEKMTELQKGSIGSHDFGNAKLPVPTLSQTDRDILLLAMFKGLAILASYVVHSSENNEKALERWFTEYNRIAGHIATERH